MVAELDSDGRERAVRDIFRLYIEPEIERRLAGGVYDENFRLYASQVIFPMTDPLFVLINEEVRGEATVQLHSPLSGQRYITQEQVDLIENFDLPLDLLDCGHATILRSGHGWRMFFNFFSGRSKALDMLNRAEQFLSCAKDAAGRQHVGPTIDNLFSSAELVAKAELILHRNPAAEAKTHSTVGSAINTWGKLGNIETAFVRLFNKLSYQRPSARYGDSALLPLLPDQEDFELIATIIDRARNRISRRMDRSGPPKLDAG